MHTDVFHWFWLIILIPNEAERLSQEALSLLFQWDGMSPAIICENAKEMVLGEFNRKLKEASHHLKQMEPFTPWSNAAEGEIK